jgi:membrane protease YdiL (CAAX protease family)
MLENDLSTRHKTHPLISLLLLLLIVAIGFVIVGPVIGFVVAMPFYPGTMMDFLEALQTPTDPDLKVPLYILQGFATFVGLIVAPAVFLLLDRKSIRSLFINRKFNWIPVFLTVLVVIIFTAANSIFIEWNSNVHFPGFLKGFESWAREREDIAMELTKALTQFDSIGQLMLAMVVIAILPAIGEEIVFRGLIQNQILTASRNAHVAIWVSAFIFSAFHFQFFGFVPRLFLGGLFGYLYYWSGNLWLSILAHFVNNGFSVLAMYFYQQGSFDYDLDKPEAVPVSVAATSAVITAGLLYFFYQYFKNRKPQPIQ